jgi:peroxiredoxin
MAIPTVGKKIPAFSAETTSGPVTAKELVGGSFVLYFYPKDDTPGCTMEAIDFTDLEGEFIHLKTVVLGVSMDDCLSHGSFRDKHGLCVQLLADVEGEVCRSYGVLQEKEAEGKRRLGVVRSTFIIDRKGMLQHALYGVNPRGHAVEVLDLVKRIGKCK